MKLCISAVAILGMISASPALTEEVVMSKPIQAGSLHEGPLDMVAYWTPIAGRGYELTATFIARTDDAEPMRIVMQLLDGDDVLFAMPNHREALYRFARRDAEITASVRLLREVVALK